MSTQIEFLERLEGDLRAAAAYSRGTALWHRTLAPRALIVAAAVLLMSGSLALAFGGRVLTALGGAPAPSPVRAEFRHMVAPVRPADGAPPFQSLRGEKIVPGSERRVLSVRTAQGTTASLYIARTTRGTLCTVTHGWPINGGGCWLSSPARLPFAVLVPTSYTPHRQTERWLYGRAADVNAARVRVIYGDGARRDVALVDGWFMFAVPASHASRALSPVRLDVLARGGATIGAFRDPFALHVSMPRLESPVVASVELLASAELPNGGGKVQIWSGHDGQGRSCFRHLRNGRSQISPAWECSAQVGRSSYPAYPLSAEQVRARGPVRWQMGLSNDPRRPSGYGYAYATGWVAPGVARLTIRNQDGSAADIALHHRYYLYVVPQANWPAGHRPSILEARDASGAVVSRQFLYPRQHCIYPGRDALCHAVTASG